MICSNCQTYNQAGVLNCTKCKQDLPVAATFPVSSNNGQAVSSYSTGPTLKPLRVARPGGNIRGWANLLVYLALSLAILSCITLGVFSFMRLTGGTRYIGFQTENLGKYDLWVARENGGQPIRVFENADSYVYPQDYSHTKLWSGESNVYAQTIFGSDKKSVFFVVGNSLWRSEVNGNDLQILFNNVDASQVGFAGDGKYLLVKVGGGSDGNEIRLIAYDIENKTSNELFNNTDPSQTQTGQNAEGVVKGLSFSVAGTRILIKLNIISSTIASQKSVVSVVDLKGGNPVEVTQPLETISRQDLATRENTPTVPPATIAVRTAAPSSNPSVTPVPSTTPVLKTDQIKRATELVTLVLSPSGRQLAWLYDIYDVRLGNSSASSPFISNITQQSRQLYTTDINGANPKLYFKDQLNTPSFSLNDERILGVLEYQDENTSTPGRQLISIAKDGKAYTLSDPFLAASSYITGASSNQKVFYYQYRVGGDNSSRTVEYFITDPKGEKRLRLSTRPGELKGFIWSPDNRHALVASQLDQNLIRFSLVNLENGSEAEIWRGSPTSQLIMGNSTFSPDGKWLAYELVPSSSSSGSSSSSSASRLLRTASIYLVNLENGRYDRQEFMRGAQSLVWSGR